MPNDQYILEHYKKLAKVHGASSTMSMEDQFIRSAEDQFFLHHLLHITGRQRKLSFRVLELGCGNGYLAQKINEVFTELDYTAIDYSPELIDIAKSRMLENINFINGDMRELNLEANSFDIIITNRSVINLLGKKQQNKALENIYSLLKPQGHYLFSESFIEPLNSLNRERRKYQLDDILPSKHNLYLTDGTLKFLEKLGLERKKMLSDSHQLSTYFYSSRVLHNLTLNEGDSSKNKLFNEIASQAIKITERLSPIEFYWFQKSN